jgi:hypothetical protein
MTKTQIFKNMHLHPTAMRELDKYLTATMFYPPHSTNFEVTKPDRVHWRLDTFDEFLAEYPESLEALYQRAVGPYEVHILNSHNNREFFSEISVQARYRHTIDTIFEFIEAYRNVSTRFLEPQPDREEPPTQPSTSQPNKATSPKTTGRDRKRPCRTPLRP